jgi:hypothetical protein
MVYKAEVCRFSSSLDRYVLYGVASCSKEKQAIQSKTIFTVLYIECLLFFYAWEKRFSCFGKHTLGSGFTHSFSIIFTNRKFRFENWTAAVGVQCRCKWLILYTCAGCRLYIQTDLQMFILDFCNLLTIIYYNDYYYYYYYGYVVD